MWGIWQPKDKYWTSVLVGKDSTAAMSKELAEQHKQELEKRFRGIEFEVREWPR